MRNIVLLAVLLSSVAAQAALAQEPNYSRTLNEQLERIRAGKSPVPRVGEIVEPFTPGATTSTTTITANSSGAEVIERDWQEERTTDVAAQEDFGALAPAAGAPTAPQEAINSIGGGAIPALPLMVYTMPNGVKYITGGVGDEEMDQLKSVQTEYNVQMLIAASGGAYLSGVTVRVTDSAGAEMFTAEDCGPYLYAQLPEGIYHFELITRAGNKQTVKVTAAKTLKKPVVRFAE